MKWREKTARKEYRHGMLIAGTSPYVMAQRRIAVVEVSNIDRGCPRISRMNTASDAFVEVVITRSHLMK